MKKVICLMLAFLMIISVASCANPGPSQPETEEPTTEEPTTEEATTEEPTTEEPTTEEPTTEEPEEEEPEEEEPAAPAVFQTGYSRQVITPNVPIGDYTAVHDDLYATCLAVYDGEKTALFISIDIGSLMPDRCDEIRKMIQGNAQVPAENIFISATHTHSAITYTEKKNGTWAKSILFPQLIKAAKEAKADLSDTEMHIGTGRTTGLAYVRRYVDDYGNYASLAPNRPDDKTKPLIGTIKSAYEVTDDTLQVVRFVRDDKKDIVLTNWQGHLAHAENKWSDQISADIADVLRKDIEAEDDDALVIFFAGASGNLNLTAPDHENGKVADYEAVGAALADITIEVMKNLTKIESGKINIKKEICTVDNFKDDEATFKWAQDNTGSSSLTYLEQSKCDYILSRNGKPTTDIRIAAVSIGELALITAPYEMFDNNGKQIKDGSEFKMTLVLTNSDGAWAYVPSIEVWGNDGYGPDGYGGYEINATSFAAGTAEKLVGEYIRMLRELKGIQ